MWKGTWRFFWSQINYTAIYLYLCLKDYLYFLLFHVLILKPSACDSLSKQLFHPRNTTNLREAGMCFPNEITAERTQTKLDHRAVEQDLCWDIHLVDGFLEVAHQHHVSSFIKPELICVRL
jgi:hypothetical protein